MQIRTWGVRKYHGCPIYIRNFLNIFEYLVIIRGEIYTANIVAEQKWWARLFGLYYTDRELVGILKTINRLADTTVETILGVSENGGQST